MACNGGNCCICLDDCFEPLFCCSAYMHIHCATSYIASENAKGMLSSLKCPHCRKAWFGRMNFDPRRYPDAATGHALVLFANAVHLQYQPFAMGPSMVVNNDGGAPRRQPTATVTQDGPLPSTSSQPSTSDQAAWEGTEAPLAEGTFGPPTGPWRNPSPPLPSTSHQGQGEERRGDDDDDDVYLDLDIPDDDDDYYDDDEDLFPGFDTGRRNLRAAEVIRALNLHEGEVIDLEEDLSITLINGRLVAID